MQFMKSDHLCVDDDGVEKSCVYIKKNMSNNCQRLVLNHMSRDGQKPKDGLEGGWQTQCFVEDVDTSGAGTGTYIPKAPTDAGTDGCATEFTRLSDCCVTVGSTASESCKQKAIEKCGTSDAIKNIDECPTE